MSRPARKVIALSVPPISARASTLLVGILAASGALLMWALATISGLEWLDHRSAVWQTAKSFVAIVTLWQWLRLIGWAVFTGMLVAVGARRRVATRPLLIAALAAGAVVPVGLLLLGGALGRSWSGASGPGNAPGITLVLLAYSLVAPWLLGSAVAALAGPAARVIRR